MTGHGIGYAKGRVVSNQAVKPDSIQDSFPDLCLELRQEPVLQDCTSHARCAWFNKLSHMNEFGSALRPRLAITFFALLFSLSIRASEPPSRWAGQPSLNR